MKKIFAQDRWMLWAALLVGLIHGLVYVWIVPPWQHYDEPNHFEYAWLIANWGRIPQAGEYDQEMRRQVAQSMIEHNFFAGEPPNLNETDKPIWIGQYSQVGEQPLYYLSVVLPLKLASSLDMTSQLRIGRAVSLFFYLLTIWAAWLAARELWPPGHSLRFLIPLTLAMLPSFTDVMTAVNNDSLAVLVVSMTLALSLRLVTRGFSLPVFLTALVFAGCSFFVKATALVALPIFLLAAPFTVLRGRVRWFAWGFLLIAGFGLLGLLLDFGEAAFWYRSTHQAQKVRLQSQQALVGAYVFQIDPQAAITPSWLGPVFQPVPKLANLQGETITFTLGGWIWADQAVKVKSPILGARRNIYSNQVQVDPLPIFTALTATLQTQNLYPLRVILDPLPRNSSSSPILYYDGLVLATGARPVDEPPVCADPDCSAGMWGSEPFENLLRNGSAEVGSLTTRIQVDRLLSRFTPDNTRIGLWLISFMDRQGSGWYYWGTISTLLRTFLGKFGWGHVPLLGKRPYFSLGLITLFLLILTFGWCLFQGIKQRRNLRMDVILLLGVLFVYVWASTIVRGASYIGVAAVYWPVARYTFPAILPTVILLHLGWVGFANLPGDKVDSRCRLWVQGSLGFLAFLALDLYAMISLYAYYA